LARGIARGEHGCRRARRSQSLVVQVCTPAPLRDWLQADNNRYTMAPQL
jgi:hypothetical protein